MPRCEYCGEEKGNAGGLASHKAHCSQNPKNQTLDETAEDPRKEPTQATVEPQPQQAQDQASQRQVPATQNQQQAQPPAQNQEQQLDGSQVGKQLANMERAPPAQRAEQQAQVAGFAFDALKGWVVSRAQQKATDAQRAENYEGEIQAAEKYPPCPVCGRQLHHVPEPGQEFECEKCGERLIA